MKYLDIINNCKLRIDSEFKEFDLAFKNSGAFPELHTQLSSHSFTNEFQLVDTTLSFYIPELKGTDENGIELSIGLFQIREVDNGTTSYSSKIKYDNNGDLVFDKFLYVSADICTTTGTYILQTEDHVISIHDVISFDKELSKAIDSIFITFKSNVELISSKLSELKNRT